jgi:hypothetical protein
MKVACLSQAELDAKLREARGAKRRKILRELQHRYDETVPRSVLVEGVDIRGLIRRYDFAWQHGEVAAR